MVIAKTDYDRAYFGDDPNLKRPSGYTKYERWYRIEDTRDSNNNLLYESKGELFKDLLDRVCKRNNIVSNKKVLELGCAKGFMVEDARALGILWDGVDISTWATSQCNPSIAQHITTADALTHLLTLQRNTYDYIVSFRFIDCIDPLELPLLITEMNRVGRKQIHIIDESPNNEFYNVMTLEQYKSSFSWARGTILVRYEDFLSSNPKIVEV